MTDARVLIFGNPAVGTVLMQSNPEIALDLPLKFLVWKSSDGVILSWNSPTWLAERFEMNPNMEVIKRSITCSKNCQIVSQLFEKGNVFVNIVQRCSKEELLPIIQRKIL